MALLMDCRKRTAGSTSNERQTPPSHGRAPPQGGTHLHKEVEDTSVEPLGQGIPCVGCLLHVEGDGDGLGAAAPLAVHLAAGDLVVEAVTVDAQQVGREGQSWAEGVRASCNPLLHDISPIPSNTVGANNGAALLDVGQELGPVLQMWPPQDREKLRIISISLLATFFPVQPGSLLGHHSTRVAGGQPAVNYWSTICQLLVNCCSVIGQQLSTVGQQGHLGPSLQSTLPTVQPLTCTDASDLGKLLLLPLYWVSSAMERL